MDPTLAVGGRYALNAVSTGFMKELLATRSLNLDRQKLVSRARIGCIGRASFSTFAVGEAEICLSKIGDEATCVFTTFRGSNLNNDRHLNFLICS